MTPVPEIGFKVKLVLSEELGIIIGKAKFAENTDSYFIRFKAGDGCQREGWFSEQAFVVVPAE